MTDLYFWLTKCWEEFLLVFLSPRICIPSSWLLVILATFAAPSRLTHFLRLETYDWRAQESLINDSLPQYRTSISCLASRPPQRVHFVHRRSTNPHAIPLLFCHGWPGSILEVSKILEPLTNPREGENVQSFHVVAPSMPGFGFSDANHAEEMDLRATAILFNGLMERLGYRRYVAHGGGR